jgi:hypothetical protein
MTVSTLGKILTIFEEARNPLSMRAVARELEISPARLEGMIQYWVGKGRIRETVLPIACGTCGKNEHCPFVIELPNSYELTPSDDSNPIETPRLPCGPGCSCGAL